jgi:hypothetical protein
MGKVRRQDRAAGAVEAAALALVGIWATLMARRQEQLDASSLLLHESGHDLRLLQREMLPRVLFALHVLSAAAVVWALVRPHRLPSALHDLSR